MGPAEKPFVRLLFVFLLTGSVGHADPVALNLGLGNDEAVRASVASARTQQPDARPSRSKTGRSADGRPALDGAKERFALLDAAMPGRVGRLLTAATNRRDSDRDKVWRSKELSILAIGMGIGDVTGDGKKNIVLIDPNTVYLYRMESKNLSLITKFSSRTLELKSVDVAKMRKRGPCRIYVSSQNRGSVASFVLEYRNGKLVPVVQNFPYFLRVILYPTQGPILLGQQKGMNRLYDGPIYRLQDKGDDLEVLGRFGVPRKIPIFGFAIGDFEGKRKPMIAVYDRDQHLRLYRPSGKRIFLSKDYYGESDVPLRNVGPEARTALNVIGEDVSKEWFRPRIMALDLDREGIYEILVIAHGSKTRRLLSRTKMLEDGQVVALVWNGDSLEERWASPKIQGMITDFTVDSLPGLVGMQLITVERKRTDWLSFLSSKSQVRAYDLRSVMNQAGRKDR